MGNCGGGRFEQIAEIAARYYFEKQVEMSECRANDRTRWAEITEAIFDVSISHMENGVLLRKKQGEGLQVALKNISTK